MMATMNIPASLKIFNLFVDPTAFRKCGLLNLAEGRIFNFRKSHLFPLRISPRKTFGVILATTLALRFRR